MAVAPPAHQANLTRLYAAARRDSATGILDQTQKVRLRHWTHWSHFCRTLHNDLDPLLQGVPTPTRVALLQAFARYVHEGHAGRGHTVRSGSVQDALCAIGKIFELDLRPNPIYKEGSHGRYWEPLNNMLRTYRCDDPRSSPQLAVPVTLPQHLLDTATSCPFEQATADLINIAFYYLLRVGECTPPCTNTTNTKAFTVRDVTFRTATGTSSPPMPPCHSPHGC